MTCGTCRHQFCWLCRGDYGPNHFSVFNPFGCPGGQFAAEDPESCFRPGPCGMFLFRLFFLPVLLPLGFALGLAAVAVGMASLFALPVIAGSLALVFGILTVIFVFFFAMRHCDSREWRIELDEAVSTCFENIRNGLIIWCLMVIHDDD